MLFYCTHGENNASIILFYYKAIHLLKNTSNGSSRQTLNFEYKSLSSFFERIVTKVHPTWDNIQLKNPLFSALWWTNYLIMTNASPTLKVITKFH